MRSLSHRASGSTHPQHRCGTSSAPDRRPEAAALEQEIRQCRRAVLVVNTRSRHGARAYSEAKRLLAEGGIALDAAYPVRNAERLHAIVREEIAKGRKFIILGGGDGTISSVVDHFAYASVVFGVLPLGTANSFARTLGIPLDLAGAIDVVGQRESRQHRSRQDQRGLLCQRIVNRNARHRRSGDATQPEEMARPGRLWPGRGIASSYALSPSAASSRSMVSRPRSRHSTF